MIIDSNELSQGHKIEAQICIIGAGAAGITLAKELGAKGISVALLEAGGWDASDESEVLYESAQIKSGPVDSDYSDDYTRWSRLRFFGGSTNHWGGWCRPFDDVDFEHRPWLEQSGWPFKRDILKSYYNIAAKIVEIEPFDFNNEHSDPHQSVTDFDPTTGSLDVEPRYFHYSPPTRFALKYKDELEKNPNVQVYLNANVTNMLTTSDGKTAQEVEITRYDGSKLSVKSKHYILACGGIENPRMLLNFSRKTGKHFGNQEDCVGRYFTDHPHVEIGLFLNLNKSSWLDAFKFVDNNPVRAMTTSKEFQLREKTLNYSCTIGKSKKDITGFEEMVELGQKIEIQKEAAQTVKLFARTEMEPQFRNRIALSDQKDVLGMNKLTMDVTYSELDRYSFQKSTEAVLRYFSSEQLGRGKLNLKDPTAWPDHVGGGCHHIGTTRMSSSAKTGVVDQNCRVHDMDNLYIAGSSVFPTGSFANPTLTIVALALKLSEHLLKEINP